MTDEYMPEPGEVVTINGREYTFTGETRVQTVKVWASTCIVCGANYTFPKVCRLPINVQARCGDCIKVNSKRAKMTREDRTANWLKAMAEGRARKAAERAASGGKPAKRPKAAPAPSQPPPYDEAKAVEMRRKLFGE